jgi:NitT/TauT family transport system substrate-binding protein
MYACGTRELARRQFLGHIATIAAGTTVGIRHGLAAAEPPPETTRVRLAHAPFICLAPQYLAEEFLRSEGFTEWDYLPVGTRFGLNAIAEGRADITMWNAPELIFHLDAGRPIVVLAGVHGGCYEVFGNDRVRSIRDLRGKTAAIHYFGGGDHILLSTMLSYVGIDPRELQWITGRDMLNAMELFAEGKADAFVGFAQEPPELRAKKIGHMILSTAQDRPWSQYFCCMVVANPNFVHRYPIATKRVLRAILKGADLCAAEPQSAARFLADKLYEPRYPIGLEVMKNTIYTHWRQTNPEDTLRFHALRLHEVGMVKTTPHKLLAQGTDWRFLNEIKRELKG